MMVPEAEVRAAQGGGASSGLPVSPEALPYLLLLLLFLFGPPSLTTVSPPETGRRCDRFPLPPPRTPSRVAKAAAVGGVGRCPADGAGHRGRPLGRRQVWLWRRMGLGGSRAAAAVAAVSPGPVDVGARPGKDGAVESGAAGVGAGGAGAGDRPCRR